MDKNKLLHKNLKIENDKLYFANIDVNMLSNIYGTPLYLLDENTIRENCRTYTSSINEYYDGNGKILYASKALCFKYLYKILESENVGIDVVSIGEIATADSVGFDLSNAFYHSNNKTDYDIKYAIEKGIGYFVVDNIEELEVIDNICCDLKIKQKILIRLTPGIDCHTLEAINTGKVDSKFGFAIDTGDAQNVVEIALNKQHIELCGFHCHVGSQVFDSESFFKSAEIMLKFIKKINDEYDFNSRILNLGGGYGVRYDINDSSIDIKDNLKNVLCFIKNKCVEYSIQLPYIIFEPGRSIVANAGLTLYTVGSVKKIKNFINYLSVDGGMGDNIRYALYGSKYTIIPINKFDRGFDTQYDVVGKYCESGDILQKNVFLPKDMKKNDIIAMLTTGAYQYSMASNYNKMPRPAIVMINNNKYFEVVRRETIEDLLRLDII